MGDPIYGDLAKLIEISIQGKKFKVPENNTCLRAFQYLSPETVSYGHFEVEETVLFPEMERHLGPLALVAELLRDHASLHGLVRLLEASATFPLLDGFSALLEAHIRKEERQLFAEFEKRMPADEARTLGKQIKTRLAEVCPKP